MAAVRAPARYVERDFAKHLGRREGYEVCARTRSFWNMDLVLR